MAKEVPLRSIRSFVRRSGRLTPAQKNAFDRHWEAFGIDYTPHPVELATVAAGYHRIKLEIGIGNGDALVSMAQNDADSFYLGVEVHRPGVGRCLNQLAANSLSNVRLICHDAIEIMQYMLPANSLDAIFLFFPDPWHKKRHNKRRIVNAQFRELSYRILKPGAIVHMATDWQDYAQHMRNEFGSDKRFINLGDETGYCDRPQHRPLTRFEQRGLKLGHGVWDLVFQKRQAPVDRYQ